MKDDRDDPTELYRIAAGKVLASDGTEVEGLVACPAHNMLTRQGLYEAVKTDADSETKRKNGMIRELMADDTLGLTEDSQDEPEMEDHPELGQVPRLDAQGAIVFKRSRRFKPYMDVRFRFMGEGGARQLEAWIVGTVVTAAMRTKLDACAGRCSSPTRGVTVHAQVERG